MGIRVLGRHENFMLAYFEHNRPFKSPCIMLVYSSFRWSVASCTTAYAQIPRACIRSKMAEQSEPASSGLTSSVSSVGEDATESSFTDSDPAKNLLFRLKAPTRSDLCRKRSVAANPPQ